MHHQPWFFFQPGVDEALIHVRANAQDMTPPHPPPSCCGISPEESLDQQLGQSAVEQFAPGIEQSSERVNERMSNCSSRMTSLLN
jgi:hypothetical protein